MPVVVSSLVFGACSRAEGSHPAPAKSAEPAHASAQRIEVAVTSEGFVPAQTRIKVGEPVTLVVTRKVDRTCVTDIVIKDYGVNKPLPEGQPVEVTFTPTKPGPIRYACAMDMVGGELVAE
jgi:plastocyanin domain-containing protein